MALVLAILTWGCFGLMQLEAHRAAAAQGRQTTLNIALGLEHDVERTIKSYDLSLEGTQRALQVPGIAQVAPDMRDAMLFDGSVEAEYLGGIVVLDTAGHLVYRSKGTPAESLDFSDRAYFKAQAANPALGLFIDGPFVSRFDAKPTIALSRRLNNPDGSFAGVVAGSIRLQYFESMFARLNLGADGVFSLQTTAGTLIARYPANSAGAPLDLGGANLVDKLGTASSISVLASSVVEGLDRFVTFQRVGPFPLLVGVGIASSALYVDWLRQTVSFGLFLFLLTLIGGWLLYLLHGELARRRRSEQAARQVAAQLEMLTDHANDIMLHVDWDGTRRFVSSACERILGRTAAEVIGTSWLDLVHPDDVPTLTDAFAAVRVGKQVGLLSYRVKAEGGALRNVETNCRALPNDEGVIFVVRDVTERTRLEERLQQSQRLEAIGQLTAGVAHDFNNMLQAQMSGLEQLSDEVADRPVEAQLVQQSLAMAERGARMTHQLLSFSRQQALRPTPVSLARVLPHLASLFQKLLGARIHVSSSVEIATPAVLVDGSYLEAALLNLALNARDAMPSGGHLTLKAYHHRDAESGIRDDLDPARRYVVIAVADDGAGMEEATLRRACEPFFTTKGANGTGLGLASVQGFARQSGGDLRITSVVGEGTRVEIWLPEAEVLAGSAAQPRAPRQAGSARILLVDDEPGILEAVGSCLVHAGFQLEQAADAEEAIELMANSAPFDALVTDFVLPGRDGADLVACARKTCPGIATLVITGWAGLERLTNLPAETEVIYKPFKRDELVGRVKRAIAASIQTA